MGKFNYANRRSEGLKLGQIVAKDVRKKASMLRSKGNSSRELTSLEIILYGKNLGDDGCAEAVAGLTDTLDAPTSEKHCKLEELNLANNALTTQSLRILARVIKLSQSDLKELDLSRNNIRVLTDGEALDWEVFLDAFAGCTSLRKLDLSANNLSGPRAYEIFTRVYYRQPQYNFDRLTGVGEICMPADVDSISDHAEASTTPREGILRTDSMITPLRQGLRAVPFIVFSNTDMTDAGALFLSDVLIQHSYPEDMVDEARPRSASTLIEDHHQKTSCSGLIYLPNDMLSGTGQKLLEQTEKARDQMIRGLELEISECTAISEYAPPKSSPVKSRRIASVSIPVQRRDSNVSSDSGKMYGEAEKSPDGHLDSFRKKVQKACIEELGPTKVEIWAVALRSLVYARSILLCIKAPLSSRLDLTTNQHLYASGLLVADTGIPGQPSLAITGTSAAHMHPQVVDFTGLPHINHRWSANSGKSRGSSRRSGGAKAVEAEIELEEGVGHDGLMPGRLPRHVWQKIIGYAVGSHDILSEVQQRAIMLYAGNRVTLRNERQLHGKPVSVQILKFLHAVGCLAYDMRRVDA